MSNTLEKGDKMEEIVFPNQLRMLRRVRGRRMIELADLLGLTISALSKIEKVYRRLNEEKLKKVAEFLDCPYEALFVSKGSSQPEVVKAWQDEQQSRRQKKCRWRFACFRGRVALCAWSKKDEPDGDCQRG